MHIQTNEAGKILHVGPTMAKMRAAEDLIGQDILDIFEFRLPRVPATAADLGKFSGLRLRLSFKDNPTTGLRAVCTPMTNPAGYLLNFSLGISLLDALRQYPLHSADFAITDQTLEMLYLIEAKSAAMEESRKLNSRLQGAMIAAEEQAFTDTLTGLKNRRALEFVLNRLIEQERPFILMGIDLDYFKSVNDSYGHAAGDAVLQQVARIMVDSSEPEDTLVRTGGDEFLMVLPRKIDRDILRFQAENLIRRIEEPVPFGKYMCRISASVGISLSEGGANISSSQLMEQMDLALYASKRGGRGIATFAGDAQSQIPAGETGTVRTDRRPNGPAPHASADHG
ncbi:MAG: GGDEF domain-containing protein [Mangrovicoccus sp.]